MVHDLRYSGDKIEWAAPLFLDYCGTMSTFLSTPSYYLREAFPG